MSGDKIYWLRRYMTLADEAMRAYALGGDVDDEDEAEEAEEAEDEFPLSVADELRLTKERLADAIGQVATLKDALRERDSQPEARAREEADVEREAAENIRRIATGIPLPGDTDLDIYRARISALEKRLAEAIEERNETVETQHKAYREHSDSLWKDKMRAESRVKELENENEALRNANAFLRGIPTQSRQS